MESLYFKGNKELFSHDALSILCSRALPLSIYYQVLELLSILVNESLTIAGEWQSPLEKNALKYRKPESDSNIEYFLAKGINSFTIPKYLNILPNNNKLLVSKCKSKRSNSLN